MKSHTLELNQLKQSEEVRRFLHMPAKWGARLSKGQDLFSCYKLPKTSFPKRKAHRKVMSFSHIQ